MLYQGILQPPSDGFPPVKELPYWWAPPIRAMWDEKYGWVRSEKNGGMRSKGGSGKGNGASVDGSVHGTNHNGVILALPAPLRCFVENFLSCGSQEPA